VHFFEAERPDDRSADRNPKMRRRLMARQSVTLNRRYHALVQV
jgi:hypothetical protein